MTQEIIPSRPYRSVTWISVVTACALVMSTGVSVAAIRYDSENSGIVFDGIEVGGVDVGGLPQDEAEALVTRALVDPLDDPISVMAAGHTFTTTPRELGATTDAIEKLRQLTSTAGMGLPQRIWTRLTRASLGRTSDVEVQVDESRLDRFINDIAAKADAPAREPALRLADGLLKIDPEAPGHVLDRSGARTALQNAVRSYQPVVELPAKTIPPASRKSDIRDVIVVKVGENQLMHYRGENLVKTYSVATGAPGYPTPKGQFKIINKRMRPTWVNPAKYPGGWGFRLPAKIGPGPGNPLGTRALDLNSPGIRIHGTSQVSSLGFNASHGCIRMKMSEVEELFDLVAVGTPVLIVQSAPNKSVPRKAKSPAPEPLAESDATVIPGQPAAPTPSPGPSPSPESGTVQLPG